MRDPGSRAACFTPWDRADPAFDVRLATVLAERDEAILAVYVEDETGLSHRRLRAALAAQTKQALVHPVFFGSAITGAGVDSLISGIAELLPAAGGDVDGPVSGTVFKVERGPGRGEDRLRPHVLGHGAARETGCGSATAIERKVTAIDVFDRGSTVRRRSVAARQIGRLWGLGDVRIGDAIGAPQVSTPALHFARPTLETVVVARRPGEKGALHLALTQLAEQDPLINVRQDEIRQETSVSLYGEVQKEVIQATLADDFDVEVDFRETTTICIERPVGTGAAVEIMREESNPFLATVGLRIEPAPVDAGVEFRLEVELGSMPFAFFKAVEDTVRRDAAAGSLWLAGDRLHRDDDPLRLRAAAEPRPSGVLQEHVEHRARTSVASRRSS